MRTALTLTLAVAAALFTLQARAADEVRNVAPFTAVSNAGPVNLRIEVGKAQSVTVGGDAELAADLQTEVSGNELKIRMRHDHTISGNHHDDVHVTITVPQLTAFTMGGAGDTTITHLSGDHLDVRFGGAGSLKAEGSVRSLTLNVGGVGAIDTRELHAETATVNVGGVGSLTYYGEPKQVNSHGGGLGSISKGK